MREQMRCLAWTAALVFASGLSQAQPARAQKLNGMKIATGTMQGRPVVLMMSGVSMVNASMNSQALLDHCAIDRIVFSGIAGGLDPALNIGDVVVPERWVASLDVAMGRELNGQFERPAYYKTRRALYRLS